MAAAEKLVVELRSEIEGLYVFIRIAAEASRRGEEVDWMEVLAIAARLSHRGAASVAEDILTVLAYDSDVV